jgi:hypothetical protein
VVRHDGGHGDDGAPVSAADRFRAAVDRLDADGMAAAMAADARLYSPTHSAPIEGRDRARMIFGILVELFEDFEYTRILPAAEADRPDGSGGIGGSGIASTQVLIFRCRVGTETIEGVDVIDVDDHDEIAALTVFIRPLSGLQALSAAIAARMAATARPPG